MRGLRHLSIAAAGAAILAGCSTGPAYYPVPPMPPPGPVQIAAPAYLFGDIVGDRRDRARKIIAAGARPLAPADVAGFLASYETELRRETAGTGVDILRQGDQLVVRMPAALTFDSGSAEIKPEFRSTLNEVSRIVSSNRSAYIDVLGHTDTTGSDSVNKTLSERRATSVRNYLVSQKVAGVRVATRGYGESMPLRNPEVTESDRAANRRVEIRVTPLRQGDNRR
jgi:outer membrane protein OmpA-like peptidoglycan-associated protein